MCTYIARYVAMYVHKYCTLLTDSCVHLYIACWDICNYVCCIQTCTILYWLVCSYGYCAYNVHVEVHECNN